MKPFTGLLLVALIVVHVVLVVDVLHRKTPTVDEVAHLPAGLSYLQQGTFRLYPHNPPLARMLSALAASTAGPSVDYSKSWSKQEPPSHWCFAMDFLAANRAGKGPKRYLLAFERGRLVIAIVSCLAIPALFLWGRWWFSPAAGLLAAFLWALSPNMIAHGGMVTTDMAFTSIALWASLTFAWWLDQPTVARATMLSGMLGLALLTKFTALQLPLLWILWAGWTLVWRRNRAKWNAGPSLLVQVVLLTGLPLLVLNLGYGFEGTGERLGDFPFLSQSLTRARRESDPPPKLGSNLTHNAVHRDRINRFHDGPLANLPVPLPRYFVVGFDMQKYEAEGKYQVYFLGELREKGEAGKNGEREELGRRKGWWFYYPLALLIKEPTAVWLLLVVGLVRGCQIVRQRRSKIDESTYATTLEPVLDRGILIERMGTLVILVLVPLLLFSLATDINLGVRYVLTILPPVYLLAGLAVQPPLPNLHCRKYAIFVGLLLAWQAVSVARVHPHELAYFSELVGGPTQGRRWLIDSNLDWGQDLRGLSRWIEKHPDWQTAQLAYWGTVPPEMEGIASYQTAPMGREGIERLLSPSTTLRWFEQDQAGPFPGKFVISVNFERGMDFHTPTPGPLIPLARQAVAGDVLAAMGGQLLHIPHHTYAYFQHFEPIFDPEIGYSLLLYDLNLDEVNEVRERLGLSKLAADSHGPEHSK